MSSNRAASTDPNWSKFGLKSRENSRSEIGEYQETAGPEDELFNRDPDNKKKPWWQSNFLLMESPQFGTWDGVFTSCMINIFGVVIFLRTGWMVGYAGLGFSVLIVSLTMLIALIAVLSAFGVCERCQIESGGVYFLLSHVLGSRIASSIGFLYCFGQAVASSLYASGFGESICALLGFSNQWIAKAIAISVLVLLLAVNLTGVKWVIRLQLILLLILFVAVLDFLVGSFIKWSPEHGVIGYSVAAFHNNTFTHFDESISFFSVFGVFFPTATGVCAGINMSGDLSNPKKSIPQGTLAAIAVSFGLYMCFTLVLAGTCTPSALQTDNMITAKVALLGPLLLIGLYVSSLSAALGGMTTAPRVLRVIAETTKLPGIGFLAITCGPNKVPVFSLLVVVAITITFILIGNINVLGPIVTMPFLMTYATLSYAYFVLAKSFDIRKRRELLFEAVNQYKAPLKTNESSSDLGVGVSAKKNGVLSRERDGDHKEYYELDRLFPERRMSYGTIADDEKEASGTDVNNEIIKQPKSCYSILINRWISLFGTAMFIGLMFGVQWVYSLIGIGIWFVLYIYIGCVSPGLFPGVAEFSCFTFLFNIPRSIRSMSAKPEHEVLISTITPKIVTESVCLTDESSDYLSRDKYHQTQEMLNDDVIKAFSKGHTTQ